MRGRIRWVAVVLLVVLGAACTGGAGPGKGSSPSPTYRPTGRIVILSGRFLTGLDLLDVASDRQLPMHLPRHGGAYNDAWPAPDGRVYAMPTLRLFSANSVSQVFLLGGRRPEPVGPTLRGATDFEARDGVALAWGCPAPLRMLDLAHPTAWRTIAHACSGTISPDGKRIAYATQRALFVMDLPDGTPREVLRFRDLPQLRAAHIPAQSLDAVLWGGPGIAVELGDASRGAMVVWREGKPPVVAPMGPVRLGRMQWQPGGNLLAFVDYAPSGEVLTLDADTGVPRQIALSDFGQLSWSPDGAVVAAPRSENVLALIRPDTGAQVGTLTTAGVPIAWLPQ